MAEGNSGSLLRLRGLLRASRTGSVQSRRRHCEDTASAVQKLEGNLDYDHVFISQ